MARATAGHLVASKSQNHGCLSKAWSHGIPAYSGGPVQSGSPCESTRRLPCLLRPLGKRGIRGCVIVQVSGKCYWSDSLKGQLPGFKGKSGASCELVHAAHYCSRARDASEILRWWSKAVCQCLDVALAWKEMRRDEAGGGVCGGSRSPMSSSFLLATAIEPATLRLTHGNILWRHIHAVRA